MTAIRFTPRGGHVEVSLFEADGAHLVITVAALVLQRY
jgi:signal transduction histidine kinase